MTVTRNVLLRNRFRAWKGVVFLGTLWLVKVTLKPPLLRRAFRALLIRVVKKTNLFNTGHYLEGNLDVAQTDLSPLRHYVIYGDREGRVPMPFFDPVYYRAQARSRLKNVNSLLHYAYVGRHMGLSPSPWFDVGFYLAHNKDVARAGIDPLLHYTRKGGLEGRSPCAQFDGAHYLRDNPDVVDGLMNPLHHYLRFGRYEGRQIHPVMADQVISDETGEDVPRPILPSEKCWKGLTPRAHVSQASVDVVVPVYKGRAETLRCLYSVLAASCDVSFELIVINDASPDVELTEDLRQLAQKNFFCLQINPENYGFVQTVNRGMTLHPDRDVVLLNSDTEVYDGWLDRLTQAAQRNSKTGTVTPLSNNATICSYPHFLHDNPFPLEIGYDALDALAAEVNAENEVEAPSAVGFCMYIKRACLQAVGLFDEKKFGRGYGEENDFSQRVINKGWRNIVAPDIFVRHWGAASFQGEKAKRVQVALKVLDRLHPNYQNDVADFIKKDPLLESRIRLDWARVKSMRKEKNVLMVSHNRGGGSERHVMEDVQSLSRKGYGVFLLRPRAGDPSQVILRHPTAKTLPNISSLALADIPRLTSTLQDLGITEIHTHSLVDFTPDAPNHLISLVKSLGVRWEVNLHDYKVICPRINLVGRSGFYCGERSETQCNQCLAEQGSDFGVSDIGDWRAMHRRALKAANTVLVPDQDVTDRLKKYFPDIHFEVSPHEEIDSAQIRIRKSKLAPNEPLRVVVLGAIGKIKGFDVLLECARDTRKRRLPIEFIVMGYSMDDRLLQEAGVRITGRYLEENAQNTLSALAPHAVWLPSMWPETYSYTLSIAQQAELSVFAFDIGAIARRVREYDPDAKDHLLPLDWASKPKQINDCFIDFRSN